MDENINDDTVFEDLGIVKHIREIDKNVKLTDVLDKDMLEIYVEINKEGKYIFTNELLEKYINFLIYADAEDVQFYLAGVYVNRENINEVLTNYNILEIFIIYLPYEIAIAHNSFGSLKERWLENNFGYINGREEIADIERYTYDAYDRDEQDKKFIILEKKKVKVSPPSEEMIILNTNFFRYKHINLQYGVDGFSSAASNANDLLNNYLIMGLISLCTQH